MRKISEYSLVFLGKQKVQVTFKDFIFVVGSVLRTGSAQRLGSQYFAAVPISNIAELVPPGFSVHNHGFCSGPNTFSQEKTPTFIVINTVMHGSILPVTIPPGHTPGDLQFCSHLAVYSPPLGTQKETIPHPWDCSSTTNTLFCVQNIDYDIDFRTIAKPDILTRT